MYSEEAEALALHKLTTFVGDAIQRAQNGEEFDLKDTMQEFRTLRDEYRAVLVEPKQQVIAAYITVDGMSQHGVNVLINRVRENLEFVMENAPRELYHERVNYEIEVREE